MRVYWTIREREVEVLVSRRREVSRRGRPASREEAHLSRRENLAPRLLAHRVVRHLLQSPRGAPRLPPALVSSLAFDFR